MTFSRWKRRKPRLTRHQLAQLEHELGIGDWIEWPGVGYVRAAQPFQLDDGRIVTAREALNR